MRQKTTLILITLLTLCSFLSAINSFVEFKQQLTPITWSENFTNDFSFKNQWSYPEGVYKNSDGQLDYNGYCPLQVDGMKNSHGKIFDDSLAHFYELVDTTHQFHSIASETSCDEWAGTDFIVVQRTENNKIICSTETNSGTHCQLILEIYVDSCSAKVELFSISSPGKIVYHYTDGTIIIDHNIFNKNILKAEFNFNFSNRKDPTLKIFWKGTIYSPIEHEKNNK